MGMNWLPRVDLEVICGVRPIESAFDRKKRVLRYRHKNKFAKVKVFKETSGSLFDKEVECCRKAFI